MSMEEDPLGADGTTEIESNPISSDDGAYGLESRLERIHRETVGRLPGTSAGPFNIVEAIAGVADLLQKVTDEPGMMGCSTLLFSPSVQVNALSIMSASISALGDRDPLPPDARAAFWNVLANWIARAPKSALQDHVTRIKSVCLGELPKDKVAASQAKILGPLQSVLNSPYIFLPPDFNTKGAADTLFNEFTRAKMPTVKGQILATLGMLCHRDPVVFSAEVSGTKKLKIPKLSSVHLDKSLAKEVRRLCFFHFNKKPFEAAAVTGGLVALLYSLKSCPTERSPDSEESKLIFAKLLEYLNLDGLKRFDVPAEALNVLAEHAWLLAPQIARSAIKVYESVRACLTSRHDRLQAPAMSAMKAVLRVIASALSDETERRFMENELLFEPAPSALSAVRPREDHASRAELFTLRERLEGQNKSSSAWSFETSEWATLPEKQRILGYFMKEFSAIFSATTDTAARKKQTSSVRKRSLELAITGFGLFPSAIHHLMDETALVQVLQRLFFISDVIDQEERDDLSAKLATSATADVDPLASVEVKRSQSPSSTETADFASSTAGSNSSVPAWVSGGSDYEITVDRHAKLLFVYSRILRLLAPAHVETPEVTLRVTRGVEMVIVEYPRLRYYTKEAVMRGLTSMFQALALRSPKVLQELYESSVYTMMARSLETTATSSDARDAYVRVVDELTGATDPQGYLLHEYVPLWRAMLYPSIGEKDRLEALREMEADQDDENGEWNDETMDPLEQVKNLGVLETLKHTARVSKSLAFNQFLACSLKWIQDLNLKCRLLVVVEDSKAAVTSIALAQDVTNGQLLHYDTDCIVPEREDHFREFHALTQLLIRVLPGCSAEDFHRWLPVYCRTLSECAEDAVLASGFYNLMAFAFQHVSAYSVNVKNDDLVPLEVLGLFLDTSMARSKQYRDDLLVQCLTFVLSVPDVLVDQRRVNRLVDCLCTALDLGLSSPSVGEIGFDALERWMSLPGALSHENLHTLLHILGTYISTTSGETSGRSNRIISARQHQLKTKSKLRFGASVKSATMSNTFKAKAEEATIAGLQLRAVRVLGRVGTASNRAILPTLNESLKNSLNWTSSGSPCLTVSLRLGANERTMSLSLDSSLPRVLQLARFSGSRQTKVVAAETLHALTLIGVGKLHSANKETHESYKALFVRLMPELLHLSIESEMIVRNLFRPLVTSLANWYSHHTSSPAAVALLDAAMDAVGHPSNGALRECAAQVFSVFFKASSSLRDESIHRIQFQRLRANLVDPDPFRRLGAVLIFNSVQASIVENQEHYFVFVLSAFKSLQLAQNDASELSTAEAIIKVISTLRSSLGRFKSSHSSRQREDLFRFLMTSSTDVSKSTSFQVRNEAQSFLEEIATTWPTCCDPEELNHAFSLMNERVQALLHQQENVIDVESMASILATTFWMLQSSAIFKALAEPNAIHLDRLVDFVCHYLLSANVSYSAESGRLLLLLVKGVAERSMPENLLEVLLTTLLRPNSKLDNDFYQRFIDSFEKRLAATSMEPAKRQQVLDRVVNRLPSEARVTDANLDLSKMSASALEDTIFRLRGYTLLAKYGFVVFSGNVEVIAKRVWSLPKGSSPRVVSAAIELFRLCCRCGWKEAQMVRVCLDSSSVLDAGANVSEPLAINTKSKKRARTETTTSKRADETTNSVGSVFFSVFRAEIVEWLVCESPSICGAAMNESWRAALAGPDFSATGILLTSLVERLFQYFSESAQSESDKAYLAAAASAVFASSGSLEELNAWLARDSSNVGLYASLLKLAALSATGLDSPMMSLESMLQASSGNLAQKANLASLLTGPLLECAVARDWSFQFTPRLQLSTLEDSVRTALQKEVLSKHFPSKSSENLNARDAEEYLLALKAVLGVFESTPSIVLLRSLSMVWREGSNHRHAELIRFSLSKAASEGIDLTTNGDLCPAVEMCLELIVNCVAPSSTATSVNWGMEGRSLLLRYLLLPILDRLSDKSWEVLLTKTKYSAVSQSTCLLRETIDTALLASESFETRSNALIVLEKVFEKCNKVDLKHYDAIAFGYVNAADTKMKMSPLLVAMGDLLRGTLNVTGDEVHHIGLPPYGQTEDLSTLQTREQRFTTSVFRCLASFITCTQTSKKTFEMVIFANGDASKIFSALIPPCRDGKSEPKFTTRSPSEINDGTSRTSTGTLLTRRATVDVLNRVSMTSNPTNTQRRHVPPNFNGTAVGSTQSTRKRTSVTRTQDLLALSTQIAASSQMMMMGATQAASETGTTTSAVQAGEESLLLQRLHKDMDFALESPDPLNDLPAMKSFLKGLDGLVRLKQLDESVWNLSDEALSIDADAVARSSPPLWAKLFLDGLSLGKPNRFHLNTRLFSLKIILNRPSMFAPYAKLALVPVLDICASLEEVYLTSPNSNRGFHTLLYDVCELLKDWATLFPGYLKDLRDADAWASASKFVAVLTRSAFSGSATSSMDELVRRANLSAIEYFMRVWNKDALSLTPFSLSPRRNLLDLDGSFLLSQLEVGRNAIDAQTTALTILSSAKSLGPFPACAVLMRRGQFFETDAAPKDVDLNHLLKTFLEIWQESKALTRLTGSVLSSFCEELSNARTSASLTALEKEICGAARTMLVGSVSKALVRARSSASTVGEWLQLSHSLLVGDASLLRDALLEEKEELPSVLAWLLSIFSNGLPSTFMRFASDVIVQFVKFLQDGSFNEEELMSVRDVYQSQIRTWRSESLFSVNNTDASAICAGLDLLHSLLRSLADLPVERVQEDFLEPVARLMLEHATSSVRARAHDVMMWCYADSQSVRADASTRASVTSYLYAALASESDPYLRKTIFTAWDRRILDQSNNEGAESPLTRVEECFAKLRLPSAAKRGRGRWPRLTTQLLLVLARRSRDYAEAPVFEHGLKAKVDFKPAPLIPGTLTSLRGRTQLAPLFSTLTSTQAGGGNRRNAVPAFARSTASMRAPSQALQAASGPSSTPSMLVAAATQQVWGSVLGAGLPPSTRPSAGAARRVRFAPEPAPSRRDGDSRSTGVDLSQGDLYRRSKQTRAEAEAAQRHSVHLVRTYRVGETPDIQFPLKELIESLIKLSGLDNGVAHELLVSLSKSIAPPEGSRSAGANVGSTGLHASVESLLRSCGSDAPTVACALEMGLILSSGNRIDPSVVADASLKASCLSNGVFAIEAQVLEAASAGASRGRTPSLASLDEEPATLPLAPPAKRARKSTKTTASSKRVSQESSGSATTPPAPDPLAHVWAPLYDLYKSMDEEDVLFALTERALSVVPAGKEAMRLRVSGDALGAQGLFNDAIDELREMDEDAAVEKDRLLGLAWAGRVDAFASLEQWDNVFFEVQSALGEEAGFEDRIFQSNNLEPHLRAFVTAGLRTPRHVRSTLAFLDASHAIPERRETLERAVPEMLVLAELHRGERPDWARAEERVERALNAFILHWSAQSRFAGATLTKMLNPLQNLVDLNDFFQARRVALSELAKALKTSSSDPRATSPFASVYALLGRWKTSIASCSPHDRLLLLEKFQQEIRETCAIAGGGSEKGLEPMSPVSPAELTQVCNAHRRLLMAHAATQARRDGLLHASSEWKNQLKRTLEDEPSERARALVEQTCVGLSVDLTRDILRRTSPPSEKRVAALTTCLKQLLGDATSIDALVDKPFLESIQRVDAETRRAWQERSARLAEVCVDLSLEDPSSKPAMETALKTLQTRCVLTRDVLDGESEFALGSYCDALRKRPEHAASAATMSLVVVESMLGAIAKRHARAINSFPRILRLLTTTATAPEDQRALIAAFQTGIQHVLPEDLLRWVAQLLASLSKGDFAEATLVRLAQAFPQTMFYSYRVARETQPSRNPELVRALDLPVLERFCTSLEYLSHPEHRLVDGIKAAQSSWGTPQSATALASLFASVLYDADEHSVGEYNDEFASEHRARFMALLRVTQRPDGGYDFTKVTPQSIDSARREAYQLKSGISATSAFSAQLASFVTALAELNLQDGDLEMPGSRDPWADSSGARVSWVRGVDPNVLVLSSIRLPKRLRLLCSDDRESRAFLVKGGEDLRQDERLEHLFGLVNSLLDQDAGCRARGLRLATYTVVPVSTACGLVSWVEDTQTLESVLSQQLARTKHDVHSCPAMRRGSDAVQSALGRLAEGEFESSARDSDVAFPVRRPREGPSFADLYRVPDEVLEEGFSAARAALPPDLLRQHFLAAVRGPEAFVASRAHFARSYAALCAATYVFGIGDRHLANFLVASKSATMVAIDFGYAFGTATSVLPVPETVPFRMTPALTDLMRPLEKGSVVFHALTKTLNALRGSSREIMDVLEIFIEDPLVDWIAQAKMAAALGGGAASPAYEEEAAARRVRAASLKLRGVQPTRVLCAEIAERFSEDPPKLAVQRAVCRAVPGADPPSSRWALSSDEAAPEWGAPLTAAQQAEELIALATNPCVLHRQYIGWKPFI